ncbi:MAG TPA: tRNA (adenosine(37)-N6)-threonylcarbamoyltransferase complex ATPase subunit type 1 TsaE [Candidatus Limnocylindria bacterium]|nr:tRNA (adenosine(37)-N6)-threonylcarbamoyltransferase complex ATPase subunit type 1 TsaE [Candidatus Limnocylindria bacterium]
MAGPVELRTAAATVALGRRLASVLRSGDLVVLSGGLGAGKTTLTQGIGRGLEVRGEVTSPTFVIARVHPSLSEGPDLVHVDAYRLGSLVEVDDLDLDASLPDAVTVVEWGAGKVEGLADDRLVVTLARAEGSTDDETRTVALAGFGRRWAVEGAARLWVLLDPDVRH